jgi:hypothetical protein
LASLAPHLPEEERIKVLRKALRTARALGDPKFSARALAALAPHLAEAEQITVLGEALSAAQAIETEHSRAEALTALAPHLPDAARISALGEALSAAEAIGEEHARAQTLAALAPALLTLPVNSRRRLARRLLRLVASASHETLSACWDGLAQLIVIEDAAACSVVASSIVDADSLSRLQGGPQQV